MARWTSQMPVQQFRARFAWHAQEHEMADDKERLISLTAEIVSAYVSHNSLASNELAGLIKSVHAALGASGSPASAPPATIAGPTIAQIRKSITPDALISFEDGKPYKTIRRHLATKGLTIDEYKTKWGLPKDYPSVAPAYSAARSEMAKSLGFGRGGRKPKKRAT
jgi:predicted transcriptional regulator